MNEHEWKKARDPEAMLAAVQDRLTRRKWVLLNCAVARRMADVIPPKYNAECFIDSTETFLMKQTTVVKSLDNAPSLRLSMLHATFRNDTNQDVLHLIHRSLIKRNELSQVADGFFQNLLSPSENPFERWQYCRRNCSEVLNASAMAELYSNAASSIREGAELRSIQKQLVLDMNKAMRNYAKPANELLTHFLHEQLGNPFQPYVFDPAWRTADVMGLARGIEADRGFDRMIMLADALMEAGCEHEGMLLHLQEEREHQRGCWVLDLILGHDTELSARPPIEDVTGTGGRHEPLGLALPQNWDV